MEYTETTSDTEIAARMSVIATVGFSGGARLVAIKTAVAFVEKEIRTILESVGTDATVSVTINFNV